MVVVPGATSVGLLGAGAVLLLVGWAAAAWAVAAAVDRASFTGFCAVTLPFVADAR